MLTNLIYLKIAVSFFLFMVMYLEWRRSRDYKARVLLAIFFAFFVKEFVLIFYLNAFIPFEAALQKTSLLAKVQGDFLDNLIQIKESSAWPVLSGYFTALHYFSSALETVFCLVLYFYLNFWIKLRNKDRLLRVVVVGSFVMIAGALACFFLRAKLPQLALSISSWVFMIWRVSLLSILIVQVAMIYKYTMLDLHYIADHKKELIGGLSFFITFYLLSQMLTFEIRIMPIFLQLLGVLMLAIFAYKYKTHRINETEKMMLDIDYERTLVISLLQDIGHAMAENLSKELVMERIVGAAIKATDARSGAVLMKDSASNTLTVEFVQGFFPPVHKIELGSMQKEKHLVDKFKNSRIEVGESYLGEVVRTGQPLFLQDCARDDRIEQTASGLMEIRTVIAVPLKVQDETVGVMAIMNKESAMYFTEGDFSLMQTLADQAAITLTQVNLYQEMLDKKQAEKELNVAGSIQKGMLPEQFPDNEHVEFGAFSNAAKGVGGDYYDAFEFEDGKIGVVCTDVAGKGVPAALVMVMIRSILRTYASREKEANDVMRRVNSALNGEISEERYATMFYFIFDTEYKILNYSNAGHGPLLLYRRALDSFALLDTDGMPVGIVPEVEYGQEYTSLCSGDIVVLYTDGVTECMNVQREQFELERLKSVIRENKDLSAAELTDTIYASIKEFAGGAPQHDDETLLLMRVK